MVESWICVLGDDMTGDAGPESDLVSWERECGDKLGECIGGIATDIEVAMEVNYNQYGVSIECSRRRVAGSGRLCCKVYASVRHENISSKT